MIMEKGVFNFKITGTLKFWIILYCQSTVGVVAGTHVWCLNGLRFNFSKAQKVKVLILYREVKWRATIGSEFG